MLVDNSAVSFVWLKQQLQKLPHTWTVCMYQEGAAEGRDMDGLEEEFNAYIDTPKKHAYHLVASPNFLQLSVYNKPASLRNRESTWNEVINRKRTVGTWNRIMDEILRMEQS